MKMRRLTRGFTLIELMITVAIAAIVIAIGIPSFKEFIDNTRSNTLSEEFSTAMNYARTEAIKRARRVSICASTDSNSCGSDWTKGFIVFVDYATADNAAAPIVTQAAPPATTILKTWKSTENNRVFTVKYGGTATDFVRFTSQGILAQTAAGAPQTIEADMNITDCKGKNKRRLAINVSGMISTTRVDCP
jgi:type IV fimbrial biogenesis protein FimT